VPGTGENLHGPQQRRVAVRFEAARFLQQQHVGVELADQLELRQVSLALGAIQATEERVVGKDFQGILK
jgi:hypothetical protein